MELTEKEKDILETMEVGQFVYIPTDAGGDMKEILDIVESLHQKGYLAKSFHSPFEYAYRRLKNPIVFVDEKNK